MTVWWRRNKIGNKLKNWAGVIEKNCAHRTCWLRSSSKLKGSTDVPRILLNSWCRCKAKPEIGTFVLKDFAIHNANESAFVFNEATTKSTNWYKNIEENSRKTLVLRNFHLSQVCPNESAFVFNQATMQSTNCYENIQENSRKNSVQRNFHLRQVAPSSCERQIEIGLSCQCSLACKFCPARWGDGSFEEKLGGVCWFPSSLSGGREGRGSRRTPWWLRRVRRNQLAVLGQCELLSIWCPPAIWLKWHEMNIYWTLLARNMDRTPKKIRW